MVRMKKDWETWPHVRFWSLSEFTPLLQMYPQARRELPDAASYYLFVDEALFCPGCAILLTTHLPDRDPVIVFYAVGGKFDSRYAADSFTELADAYLREDTLVFASPEADA